MGDVIRIVLIIGTSAILRYAVTYHPYSGENTPPMYGDYEAQRHWQEITVNLPIDDWYINSTNNDLQYWGLDYPPLTAYHSFIIGKIGNYINPDYVKLHESRGYESADHKLFMRLTVFIADFFIYLPAIIYYFYANYSADFHKNVPVNSDANIFGFNRVHLIIITALIYPGIILIDHGHFQYNCVSLGFFIFSVTYLIRKKFVLGSGFFVLALNYKQMELYHALPIFFYILGTCKSAINRQKSIYSSLIILTSVSATVITTFLIIWLPFLNNYRFIDVIIRLFPISRGVFEDKVSNIWCAINVFIKLRDFFDNYQLAKICLITTIVFISPSCLDIFYRPFKDKFLLSLINVSLGFYLFSFQVHEKTILLVAIPVLLYLHRDPLPCFWFLVISVFSMLPLLIKDGLIVTYWALMILYVTYVLFITNNFAADFTVEKPIDFGSKKLKKFRKFGNSLNSNKRDTPNFFNMLINGNPDSAYVKNCLKKYYFIVSFVGMTLLSLSIGLLKPPDRYPDLFPLLISIYSCIHFLIFFVYFNVKQILLTNRKSMKIKTHLKCE